MKQIRKVDVVALYDALWAVNGHEEVRDLIKHTCKPSSGRKHGHTCPHCKTRWQHSAGSADCPLCHMCPECGALHTRRDTPRRVQSFPITFFEERTR